MQRIRTPGTPDVALTTGDRAYIDVTPYTFKQICKQLALRDSVKLAADGSGRLETSEGHIVATETSEGLIVATETLCHCLFSITWKMPSRHIFAVRKTKGMSLFEQTLVADKCALALFGKRSSILTMQ